MIVWSDGMVPVSAEKWLQHLRFPTVGGSTVRSKLTAHFCASIEGTVNHV